PPLPDAFPICARGGRRRRHPARRRALVRERRPRAGARPRRLHAAARRARHGAGRGALTPPGAGATQERDGGAQGRRDRRTSAMKRRITSTTLAAGALLAWTAMPAAAADSVTGEVVDRSEER